MKCVRTEQLLDFTQGRAEAATAERIREHLDGGCRRCQGNLDWLHKIVRLAATDESVEPPAWVFNRAVRLFNEHGPHRTPSFLERLVASLTFDSLAQVQLAGARQSGQATRQCLYQAGEWDVDLSFEVGEESEFINITGQVLASRGEVSQVAGLPVQLIQAGQTLASTVTDRLGEFAFDRVAGGEYDLKIDLPNYEVWIEHVDVKVSE